MTPERPVDVVFLGDSISAWGLWNEWFPTVRIANRGIDGDRVAGVLARLASVPRASTVLLLIGTNDLTWGTPERDIVGGVEKIMRSLAGRQQPPRTVVQSVMPRSAAYTSRIRSLNDGLSRVARAAGAEWLDLWPALATPAGTLRPEFTADRVHLNGSGYAAWVAVLRAHNLITDHKSDA